jgi:hypothetical protein
MTRDGETGVLRGAARKDASLREQSSTLGSRPRDAAIFRPRDIRDIIVPHEPFIEE